MTTACELEPVLIDKDDERLCLMLRKQWGDWPAWYRGVWFGIEQEGQLLAVGNVRTSNVTDEACALLFSGIVREDARGRGLHRQLIRARLEWARDQGCVKAYVCTHRENDSCVKNLEREGFKADSYHPDVSMGGPYATYEKVLS